jgi:hypothetical protein
VRDKNDRAGLASLLKNDLSALTPEMRLRSYLAVKHTPEPALLTVSTIQDALTIVDCASTVRRLAIPVVLLDVRNAMLALAE